MSSTASLEGSTPAPRPDAAGYPFAAFLWAVAHAPLFLAFYASSIVQFIRATPAGYRAALAPTYLVQAGVLGLAAFVLALPAAPWPRVFRRIAPALCGLATAVLALDSRVFANVAFHLNGFFLRVLVQPNALKETGVPIGDVVLFVLGAAAWVAIEIVVGGRFIVRYARSDRRTWAWALGLLLLGGIERVYAGSLTYFGGAAIFAASTALPLVAPIRMSGTVASVLGRPESDPFSRSREAVRLPPALPPEAIRFTRTPDVLLLVAESLPEPHLDAATMPRLWARAAEGARFTRFYSGASSTHYSLFSLLYGVQAQKLESTLGAGRQALLFPALRANGYQLKLLAASCVDWMGLKETVFGSTRGELETWCNDVPWEKLDDTLEASARRWVDGADPDRPIFMFLFFQGTHFNYLVSDSETVFRPQWDGKGEVWSAETVPAEIQNRARNAAHFLDGKIDRLVRDIERRRGRRPLIFFTGDHGEEFRQKGHLGHGSAVTDEQVHVPMAVVGDGVPRGVFDAPTGHADVVPTLFRLLGDTHAPSTYSDGTSLFDAEPSRFVVTTVGWEPSYAAIGQELKVTMYAGLASAEITDPNDRPLADGAVRMAAQAGRILRALRGETGFTAAGASPPTAAVGAPPPAAAVAAHPPNR